MRVIAGCEERRFSVREKPGGVGSSDEDEVSKWRRGGVSEMEMKMVVVMELDERNGLYQ